MIGLPKRVECVGTDQGIEDHQPLAQQAVSATLPGLPAVVRRS
jgi:hypothetical protein